MSESENIESKDVENPIKLSPFLVTITKIAMEEGDYISHQTLTELEEMVTPDKIPQKRGHVVVRLGFEITNDQLDTVKKVISVVKDCLEIGGFISEKLGKFLGPIGAVAGLVSDLIDLFEPEKEDPVMKELGELKKQLTALSQKMTAHFDDLKSFIVEQNFYDKYTTSLTKLYMYMLDTLTHRTKESVKTFEEIYRKNKPQELVYEMLAKLEQDSTNPLRWAMKGDHLQSKATFQKWKNILEGAISEALFLETYASGLLPDVGKHGINMILEKIGRFQEIVKKWDDYYLNTDDFWPKGVQKLVDEVHENKSLSSKNDKIDEIWKGILSIHTNFKFYVVVVSTDHIVRYYKHYEDQAITSSREGFHIMVYRSARKQARDKRWLDQYMFENMEESRSETFQFDHWQIVRNHLSQDNIDRIGKYLGTFYFVVGQSSNHIASKFSIMDGSDGPGCFTFSATLECSDGFSSTTASLFKLYGN
ncbi:hypothetical protein GCK72_010626 [Caenorhabditis remanei]|uniref:Uncharacterized protein n=1 Tax=Caenorhabditis remanei TaxID=31234 RepID=A0A6A5H6H4_CAERE|nr:hypothetical protein GCK72_010626 [Caenorhabditis remanei]KAF1762364.1 hypothetical protein GCK72_010626 [Caenorhabditis remanei]